MDPKDSLKLAETESLIWWEAQASITQRVTLTRKLKVTVLPQIPERQCFTNESWKENDIYSCQGWYNTLKGFDGLMGQETQGRVYHYLFRS